MHDVSMSDAVYEALFTVFTKKRTNADVNLKAAQMIAIELLIEGWSEMSKLKIKTTINKPKDGPVGM